MEKQVQRILYKVYSPPSENSNPRDALQEINLLWENPHFYQALFTLFKNQSIDPNIRKLSIIVLKQQIHFHWDNFSPEFQQVFLQNIPELVIGITTKEFQYLPYLTDLIEHLISKTFIQYFKIYWVQLLTSLFPASKDHFITGLLFLICLLKVVLNDKEVQHAYMTNEQQKESLKTFFYSIFEIVTAFYVSSEADCYLRTLCLKIALSMVKLYPSLCLETNFYPWYQTVAWCISPESANTIEPSFELPAFSFSFPLNDVTSSFFAELLNLFRQCQLVFLHHENRDEVPFSTQLFLILSNIILSPDWTNNSNQNLFIPFFEFFKGLICYAKTSWANYYLGNFPQILQQLFFPLFMLPPNALEIVSESPFQFIDDYHIETFDNNDDHTLPNQEAYSALGSLASKNSETHEILFAVAVSALESYCSNNNVIELYSLFQFASSYWGALVLSQKEAVTIFNDHLLQMLVESFKIAESPQKWLFQSAILLILSQSNPRPPRDSHRFNIINPAYLETSIHLLNSPSPLIHYFASYTIFSLLYIYKDIDLNEEQEAMSNAAHESLLDVCAPHSLQVINSIIEYAQKYGKTRFALIITILIKNDKIIQNIMTYLPNFVDSIFVAAASLIQVEKKDLTFDVITNDIDVYYIFLTLINLIDHLDRYSSQHDQICMIIFAKCLQCFPTFSTCPAIYELLAIILGKSPTYVDDLYNQIFQPIVAQITNPLFIKYVESYNSIINESSLIFHNMMVRSPQFMITIHNQNGNCLFSLGELMIQSGDYTTMTMYFSGLMALIEPDKFPHEFFEELYDELFSIDDPIHISAEVVNINYRPAFDLFYYMFRYDPQYFIQQDSVNDTEVVLNILEIANDIDHGYIISIISNFLPKEVRNEELLSIVANVASPQILIENYHSDLTVDNNMYEDEENFVNQSRHYVSSFPPEQALKTFIDYLRNLLQEEPDVIQIFQNYMPNLNCLLQCSI